MRIAVDARPLQESKPGGVRTYTKELITALTNTAPQHSWRIFFNSFVPTPHFLPQTKTVSKKIPNKLLNTSLLLSKRPKLDRFTKADIWISPNLNFTSLQPNTKHIQVVHDLSFIINPSWYSKKSQLWHKAIRVNKIFNRANHIVCVSDATKHDVISNFPQHKEKVCTIYPGTPQRQWISATDLKNTKEKFNLPPHFFLFFDGGGRKNTQFVLDAFKHFKQTNNLPHQLVVVGGGNAMSFWSRATDDRIPPLHIPTVSEKEKTALLKLSNCLLYPSIYEGFGFPPLEAMSESTPVIASWSSSLPEVIGEAGLLVSPYKPHELSHAMNLVTQPKIRQKLTQEGTKQTQKFTWHQTAKDFLKLITEN